MNEEWRLVKGYNGRYEISSHGRIRRHHRKTGVYTYMIPQKCGFKRRYCFVVLSNHGETKQHYVHRLVLEAFVGPAPDGFEACHFDGDANNNSINNLRWGSHTSNQQDMAAHGNSNRGQKQHRSKLSESDVRQIRTLHPAVSANQLSDRFAVSIRTIYDVLERRTWAWLKS